MVICIKPQVTMFQFTTGTGGVNYRNADERNQINEKIADFQNTHGVCVSFKELFEQLLNTASNEQSNHAPVEVEVIPENAILIGETKADLEKFRAVINEFKHSASLTDSYSFENIILAAISLAKTPEIKEVPVNLPENTLVITLTDEPARPAVRKMEILTAVQANRFRKLRIESPEPLSKICESLIFSEGALFNHGGDVFTGF